LVHEYQELSCKITNVRWLSQLKIKMVVITLPFSMKQPKEQIKVIGAREHNLKNFDIAIPKNELVVLLVLVEVESLL